MDQLTLRSELEKCLQIFRDIPTEFILDEDVEGGDTTPNKTLDINSPVIPDTWHIENAIILIPTETGKWILARNRMSQQGRQDATSDESPLVADYNRTEEVLDEFPTVDVLLSKIDFPVVALDVCHEEDIVYTYDCPGYRNAHTLEEFERMFPEDDGAQLPIGAQGQFGDSEDDGDVEGDVEDEGAGA
jgi:hypothetical protein